MAVMNVTLCVHGMRLTTMCASSILDIHSPFVRYLSLGSTMGRPDGQYILFVFVFSYPVISMIRVQNTTFTWYEHWTLSARFFVLFFFYFVPRNGVRVYRCLLGNNDNTIICHGNLRRIAGTVRYTHVHETPSLLAQARGARVYLWTYIIDKFSGGS